MDCDLARMLLHFRARDLEAADADTLARHLEFCPSCAAKAAAMRGFDAELSRAMVAVPARGRASALRTVELAFAARRRAKFIRGGCVAASVLVVAGLVTGTAARLRPEAESYRIAVAAGRAVENPQAEVRDYFADRDLPLPPVNFDYANYLNHGRLPILGTDAPAVAFTRAIDGRRETATAFALTPGRFRLADLNGFAQASFYNVTVIDDPAGSGVKWAIVHTTPDLSPFERKPDA